MAEPEPEREGGYVPWDVPMAVEAQKSLEAAGVDPAAELLSLTGGGKAPDVPAGTVTVTNTRRTTRNDSTMSSPASSSSPSSVAAAAQRLFDRAETQRLGGDTCAAQRLYAAVLEIEPAYTLAEEWIDTLRLRDHHGRSMGSPGSGPNHAAFGTGIDHGADPRLYVATAFSIVSM
jgi:hypothetical protein